MQITHIQKNVHTSPRKLRLVADMIRKMQPLMALQALEFTPKDAAVELSKALKTALANARVQQLDTGVLTISKLEINEGYKMKRARPASRGRRKPYTKRTGQIRIVLTDEVKGVN